MAIASWGTGRPDYSQIEQRVAPASLRSVQVNIYGEVADALAASASTTFTINGPWSINVAGLGPTARYIIKQVDFTSASNTMLRLTLQSSQSTSTIINKTGYQDITVHVPDGIDFGRTENAVFTLTNLSSLPIDYAFSTHGIIEVPL